MISELSINTRDRTVRVHWVQVSHSVQIVDSRWGNSEMRSKQHFFTMTKQNQRQTGNDYRSPGDHVINDPDKQPFELTF